MSLYQDWISAKEVERQAVESRRAIEDQLIAQLGIQEIDEGTLTAKAEGFTIKAVSRLNRKIDADKLQDIAHELGLSSHLSQLFRWKPEINMTAWKSTADDITNPLLAAITTTPGRPSFTITKD